MFIKKKLIIYQSISEINEIYKILTSCPFNSCVILITGNQNFYDVLKYLNLKKKFGVKVFEFNVLSLKNPLNIFKMFYNFNFSKNFKTFLNYKFEEAIFFNKYIDFAAPIFLYGENVKNIKYINLYKPKVSKKKIDFDIKKILQIAVFKFIYFGKKIQIKFKEIRTIRPSVVPFFYIIKKKIQNVSKSKKKIYKLNCLKKIKLLKNNSKKNVIYLDSSDEIWAVNNFGETINKLFNFLIKLHFKIIIVPHGRVKLSKVFLNNERVKILKNKMPVQMYDLSNVKYILGYFTSALPIVFDRNPNVKVISLVRIINSNKNVNFIDTKEYHTRLCKNKIYYPKNLKNLYSYLKTNKK